MLGAVRLASALLRSGETEGRVLCISADRFPEGAKYEQSYNVISDGAAAQVASSEPGPFRIVASHGIINGALAFANDDEVVGSFFSYMNWPIQESLEKADVGLKDLD